MGKKQSLLSVLLFEAATWTGQKEPTLVVCGLAASGIPLVSYLLRPRIIAEVTFVSAPSKSKLV